MQRFILAVNTVNSLYVNEIASGRFAKDVEGAIATWQSLADRNQQEFAELWQTAKPYVFNAIRFTGQVCGRIARWYRDEYPVQLQAFLVWMAATYAWFVDELPTVEEIYTEIDEMQCDVWELVEVQPIQVCVQPSQFAFASLPLLPPAKIEATVEVQKPRRKKSRKGQARSL